MKKWKKCPLLIVTAISMLLVSGVALAGTKGAYKEYNKDWPKVPAVAGMMQASKEGILPWDKAEPEEDLESIYADKEEPATEEATEAVIDTEAEADKTYTFTDVTQDYFDDAVFIGDSRTVGLSEYADLGDADVFATIGLSCFKLFETQVDMPGYGKETLDEVLSRKNYGKIYLMLGINELGYPHASIEKQYREVVEKIREMQPDAILFLEASLHVSKAKSDSDSLYNNANIDWLNGVVESLCDQKQTYYIDVNEIFDDGAGNLDAQYTSDDAHPLGKYYAQWAEWILTKAIVKEK